MERGKEGYEELEFFYGIIEETKISKKIQQNRDAITKIREYIKGPRSPNRTLIHSVLSPLNHEEPWVDKIESLTMSVTMGEKEWEEYIDEIKIPLDQWDNEVKKREEEIQSLMYRPTLE
jgi:hypothetical protein